MPDALSRAIAERALAAAPGLPDAVRMAITATAEYGIILAGLIALAVAWSEARGDRLGGRIADLVWILFPAGVAVVLAIALSVAIGILVPIDRPFVALGQSPLFAYHADASFPSDHVAAAMALLAAPLRSRTGRAAIALVALLVGAARILAGVHWLSDIVGGAILGLALAWLVGRTWQAVVRRPGPDMVTSR